MSETDLRHTVRDMLGRFGKVQAIESPIEKGIPDECMVLRFPSAPGAEPNEAVTSWVELKHRGKWPSRLNDHVKFDHFTKEQLLWLEGWHKAGGHCALLMQAGSDYLLLPPWHLRVLYDGAPRRKLEEVAVVRGEGKFPTGALLRWLTKWKS